LELHSLAQQESLVQVLELRVQGLELLELLALVREFHLQEEFHRRQRVHQLS